MEGDCGYCCLANFRASSGSGGLRASLKALAAADAGSLAASYTRSALLLASTPRIASYRAQIPNGLPRPTCHPVPGEWNHFVDTALLPGYRVQDFQVQRAGCTLHSMQREVPISARNGITANMRGGSRPRGRGGQFNADSATADMILSEVRRGHASFSLSASLAQRLTQYTAVAALRTKLCALSSDYTC